MCFTLEEVVFCRMPFSLWENHDGSSVGFGPFLHALLACNKVNGCALLPDHGNQAVQGDAGRSGFPAFQAHVLLPQTISFGEKFSQLSLDRVSDFLYFLVSIVHSVDLSGRRKYSRIMVAYMLLIKLELCSTKACKQQQGCFFLQFYENSVEENMILKVVFCLFLHFIFKQLELRPWRSDGAG